MKSYSKRKKFLGIVVNTTETVPDSLSGAEDGDLDLLLGHVEDSGNVLVALSLHVAQLHASALFLR